MLRDLFSYLYIYLSIYLSSYLSLYLSIYLSFYPLEQILPVWTEECWSLQISISEFQKFLFSCRIFRKKCLFEFIFLLVLCITVRTWNIFIKKGNFFQSFKPLCRCFIDCYSHECGKRCWELNSNVLASSVLQQCICANLIKILSFACLITCNICV